MKGEGKGVTYCDMPRHVMLACEGGRICTLPQVYDGNEHPYWGDNPIRKDAGTECTCEPPEPGMMTTRIRISRRARGVEQ